MRSGRASPSSSHPVSDRSPPHRARDPADLGLIFFSAFYSLAFQIEGLVGPNGILPAHDYLVMLRNQAGPLRYWFAPTLLWLGSGTFALHVLVWAGLLASAALFLNLWPRGSIAVAFVAYLSFVAAARNFADYQSDGMLLAAAFISLFFAPPGLRPGLGEACPPSPASLFLLTFPLFFCAQSHFTKN